MRFIHCADIHLDSPLVGLSGRSREMGDLVRDATRRALGRLVDLAIAQGVDFVVVAGDLYDGDWRDFATGMAFVREAGRLHQAGIPLFLALGNHDAQNRMTAALPLPPNVQVFSSRSPETRAIDTLQVALHGWSYREAAVTHNPLPLFPDPRPGWFNIGVLHTAADGRGEGHAPYAPCHPDQLAAKGYDYWALGHVHQRQALRESPPIHYSGNLQGRHARESGAKGFNLVEVTGGRVTVTFVAADVVRWRILEVDVTGAPDREAALARVSAALRTALEEADERVLCLRLVLAGRCRAHRMLLADPRELAAECQALGLALGERLWVEKVLVRTDPEHDLVLALEREDMAGELLRLVNRLADDPETHRLLAEELAPLGARLPAEARAGWEEGNRPGAALLEDVLAESRALVAHRLLDREDG